MKHTITIIMFAILLVSCSPLTFTNTQQQLTQYTSKYTDIGHYIIAGDEAKVAGYTIHTYIDSYRVEPEYTGGYPIYECETNICVGLVDYTDSDNCVHYKQISTQIKGNNVYYPPTASRPSFTCDDMYCYNCNRDNPLAGCIMQGVNDGCCQVQDVVTTCGGLKLTNKIGECCPQRTCWSRFDVYKDDTLIFTQPWKYCLNNGCNNFATYDFDYLRFNHFVASDFANGDCQWVSNTFSVTLQSITTNFTLLNNNMVRLNVYNPNLDMHANIAIADEGGTTITQLKSLLHGTNTYDFPIITNSIIIANIDLLFKGSSFTNVNGLCYNQQSQNIRDLSNCSYVLISRYESEPYIVAVSKCSKDEECSNFDIINYDAKCFSGSCVLIEKKSPDWINYIISGGIGIAGLALSYWYYRRRKH